MWKAAQPRGPRGRQGWCRRALSTACIFSIASSYEMPPWCSGLYSSSAMSTKQILPALSFAFRKFT